MTSQPITFSMVRDGRLIGTARYGCNQLTSVHAAACVLCGDSVSESTMPSFESTMEWLADHWIVHHGGEIR